MGFFTANQFAGFILAVGYKFIYFPVKPVFGSHAANGFAGYDRN
jgi:hypothetical protein